MINNLNRRNFIKLLGIGATAFTFSPLLLKSETSIPNIVIIGGGFSGEQMQNI